MRDNEVIAHPGHSFGDGALPRANLDLHTGVWVPAIASVGAPATASRNDSSMVLGCSTTSCGRLGLLDGAPQLAAQPSLTPQSNLDLGLSTVGETLQPAGVGAEGCRLLGGEVSVAGERLDTDSVGSDVLSLPVWLDLGSDLGQDQTGRHDDLVNGVLCPGRQFLVASRVVRRVGG